MFVLESIAQARRSLQGHRLRTSLTMFGIVWGITSMIILVGMGKSSQKLLYQEFRKIGDRMIVVWAGQSTSGLAGVKGGRPVRFTVEDTQAIRNHCPNIELASPQIPIGFQKVECGSKTLSCDTFGVDEDSGIIRKLHIDKGRFISSDDIESARRVCILGAGVKEKLFGDRQAIGDSIRVGGIRLQVIGVLKRKGDQLSRPFYSLDDDQISIPYTTAQNLFTGSKYFSILFLQPYSLDVDEMARAEVRETLALRHGFTSDDADAIGIFGVADMMGRVKGVTVGMQIFLGVASLVTLLMGGVGVMNIMFVSINERIREVGIIKAVGAKKRQVFLQFLVESIFITFLAGLIGVFLGCSICLVLGLFELPRLVAAPEINPFVIALSFIILTLVGILSGILPALRASGMQIVEALRSY
jgi:putative ABC transport system permease protein